MNTKQTPATANTTTRRDPLDCVVDFDLLEMVNTLVQRDQNVDYWAKVRTPKCPDGSVRFEAVRQVLVFAVPAAITAAAFMAFDWKVALLATPVAAVVGYVQDHLLTKAIAKQRAADEDLDRGRYRASLYIAERLGLTVEEIDPVRMMKMYQDYLVVKPLRDANILEMRKQEARERAKRPSRRFDEDRDSGRRSNGHRYASEGSTRSFDDYAPAPVNMPGVNPVSGLPLIEGTFVDVGGNAYGTTNT